jgi:hypothetical protein
MEILVEVPGEWEFTEEAFTKDGLDYTKIKVSEEVEDYKNLIIKTMEDAQTYTFNKIPQSIPITGKAEANAAPFWLH